MLKYAIVTGGNAGLGLETSKELCRRGFYVTITARSAEKGVEAVVEVTAEVPAAQMGYLVMELKDLNSVKACANDYIKSNLPLNLLVNNAGIMNTPFEMTSDGFEAQFQVNHLGHFLFTHYLLPRIKQSGGGRVINVSSRAHMRWSGPLDLFGVRTETPATYDGWTSYGRSKLANILFARTLAKKFPFEESKISFNALHPGLVDTKLLNVAAGLKSQAITVTEGIQCCLHLSTSLEVEGVTGEYFHDSQIAMDGSVVSDVAKSDVEADRLWTASLEFVGLTDAEYGM
jgi:NAD(P)-dependent dehydrogenase (short-subunit alcohol dehydrogenase family)